MKTCYYIDKNNKMQGNKDSPRFYKNHQYKFEIQSENEKYCFNTIEEFGILSGPQGNKPYWHEGWRFKAMIQNAIIHGENIPFMDNKSSDIDNNVMLMYNLLYNIEQNQKDIYIKSLKNKFLFITKHLYYSELKKYVSKIIMENK